MTNDTSKMCPTDINTALKFHISHLTLMFV